MGFLALASTCGVFSQELRGGVTGTKVHTGKIAPVEVAGGFFPSSASPDDEENDYGLEGEEVRPGEGESCTLKRGQSPKRKCGRGMYCKTKGCPKKGEKLVGTCRSMKKCNFMTINAERCSCNGKKKYGNPRQACSDGANIRKCRKSEEGIKLFVDGEWDGAED